jgi:hypothetical protein
MTLLAAVETGLPADGLARHQPILLGVLDVVPLAEYPVCGRFLGASDADAVGLRPLIAVLAAEGIEATCGAAAAALAGVAGAGLDETLTGAHR